MNDSQPSRQQVTKPALEKYQGTLMRMEEQFRAALPAQIPSQKFVRVALTAVQINPNILTCDERSIFTALLLCANDGLLPDGREAAIVPRMGTAVYMPMVAGIRKKARNSGEIASWEAHTVHENDFFEYALGDSAGIIHKPTLSNRGAVVAAYSICRLTSGELSREVMGIEEIERLRDRSDAWKAFKANKIKSTPWQSDFDEMCRKTVVKRHAKSLPVSAEVVSMLEYDNEIEENGPAVRRGRPPKQEAPMIEGPAGNGNGSAEEVKEPAEEVKEPAEEEKPSTPPLDKPLREPGDDSDDWRSEV